MPSIFLCPNLLIEIVHGLKPSFCDHIKDIPIYCRNDSGVARDKVFVSRGLWAAAHKVEHICLIMLAVI